MAMTKEVPGSALREGDVIRHQGGELAIRWLDRHSSGEFTCGDEKQLLTGSNRWVFTLLRRPWPDGKKRQHMLARVHQRLLRLDEYIERSRGRPDHERAPGLARLIRALREACEEYELGDAPPIHAVSAPEDVTQGPGSARESGARSTADRAADGEVDL